MSTLKDQSISWIP